MESLIEFQKLHIEQNNTFAQLAYATSSEELEAWINYNTSTAAAINDALISDQAKLKMLVEFSFYIDCHHNKSNRRALWWG